MPQARAHRHTSLGHPDHQVLQVLRRQMLVPSCSTTSEIRESVYRHANSPTRLAAWLRCLLAPLRTCHRRHRDAQQRAATAGTWLRRKGSRPNELSSNATGPRPSETRRHHKRSLPPYWTLGPPGASVTPLGVPGKLPTEGCRPVVPPAGASETMVRQAVALAHDLAAATLAAPPAMLATRQVLPPHRPEVLVVVATLLFEVVQGPSTLPQADGLTSLWADLGHQRAPFLSPRYSITWDSATDPSSIGTILGEAFGL